MQKKININENRYARHLTLEEIGHEGQKKLLNSSVLVIGAGGLGCPALQYLVAAGVGHIGIADHDTVDETNLQRQILYSTNDIGKPKAEIAKQKLTALNPDVQIEIYPEGLTANNVEILFKFYDVVIDATDNFETKYLINDAAHKYDTIWIYASINKHAGQVATFSGETCFRCLFPSAQNHIPNCAEAGVLGAVAGLVGTTQAIQATQILLAHENFKPLFNKLWSINTKTMQTQIFDIVKDKSCPLCSKNKETIMFGQNNNKAKEVTIEDVKSMSNPYLLDVREQDEWDAGHIDGAELFPLSKLMQGQTPDLPDNENIIIYCGSGKRSLTACEILKNSAPHAKSMRGGYIAWIALN